MEIMPWDHMECRQTDQQRAGRHDSNQFVPLALLTSQISIATCSSHACTKLIRFLLLSSIFQPESRLHTVYERDS